jgi:hypothetical protein
LTVCSVGQINQQNLAIMLQEEFGNNSNFQRVGTSRQTDGRCGQTLGIKGCLNIDLHAHFSLDGINHAGKGYFRKIVHSCDKPECAVCFKRGWAVREASAVEYRINQASKHFGVAEHIVASVPKTDYGLSFSELKAKTLRILRNRGIIGGVLIFHAQRFSNRRESIQTGKPFGWFFSPHWHVIGFIDGGYSKCRHCSKSTLECLTCNGFDGRTRREYYKEGGKDGAGNSGSGWIVDVKGARKTIHGTAFYQLNHATLVRGTKRSIVTTWFGVCSYVKLRLKKEDRVLRDICPICQHTLEEVIYVGVAEPEGLSGFDGYFAREWEEPYLDKNGLPNWIPKPRCME